MKTTGTICRAVAAHRKSSKLLTVIISQSLGNLKIIVIVYPNFLYSFH